MGEETKIAWTNKTWNPHQGCRKVSPGCRECYMERDKRRYGQDPLDVHRSAVATFNAPLKWKEPALVFVCSWSDFFIEEADAWRAEEWAIIKRCPHLTFQIPTKRPERIAACLPPDWGAGYSNVWLGVSAEDQSAWNLRVPILQDVRAAVRWVSVEPMIGMIRPLRADLVGLSWVVIGGESGPKARPFGLEWARSLKAACWAGGLKVFVKQLGERPFSADVHDIVGRGRRQEGSTYWHETESRSGSDPAEWTQDLRCREWPEVAR